MIKNIVVAPPKPISTKARKTPTSASLTRAYALADSLMDQQSHLQNSWSMINPDDSCTFLIYSQQQKHHHVELNISYLQQKQSVEVPTTTTREQLKEEKEQPQPTSPTTEQPPSDEESLSSGKRRTATTSRRLRRRQRQPS